jgi:hypothetical protein
LLRRGPGSLPRGEARRGGAPKSTVRRTPAGPGGCPIEARDSGRGRDRSVHPPKRIELPCLGGTGRAVFQRAPLALSRWDGGPSLRRGPGSLSRSRLGARCSEERHLPDPGEARLAMPRKAPLALPRWLAAARSPRRSVGPAPSGTGLTMSRETPHALSRWPGAPAPKGGGRVCEEEISMR